MFHGVVYKRTNIVNGKIYVGITSRSPEERWKEHIQDSKNKNKSSFTSPFYKAIRKYGQENFILEILYECDTQEELYEKEKFFADHLNTWNPKGYNLRAGSGPGSTSEETRNKISENSARISGEKHYLFGKRGVNTPRFGMQHSNDSKEKMAMPKRGKVQSEDTISKRVEKTSKVYKFLSPSGEEITIKNLKKFCETNRENLCPSSMRKVFYGKRKQHKGWRRANELACL